MACIPRPAPHLGAGRQGTDRESSADHERTFCVVHLSLDQGLFRRLTNPPTYTAGDTAPAVSPGGRSLVFRRTTGFASGQLYLVAVDLVAVNKAFTLQGEP